MIKFIADISADIPKEIAEQKGLAIMPFCIIADDDETFVAGIDYTPQMFYDKLKTMKGVPKTGQTPLDCIEETYRKVGADGAQIIHVSIPEEGSGTINSCRMIAKRLNEEEGFDITIVDSRTYSFANGFHVLAAMDMAEQGKTRDEIVEYLEKSYSRDRAYFSVDDLTFLKKGGRIKATTATFAKALDIKPILRTNEGLVEVIDKVRGTKKSISKMVDYAVEKMDDPTNNEVVILESECPEKVEFMKKQLEEKLHPAKITAVDIGPIITCHAGTNVIGIFFKHKEEA